MKSPMVMIVQENWTNMIEVLKASPSAYKLISSLNHLILRGAETKEVLTRVFSVGYYTYSTTKNGEYRGNNVVLFSSVQILLFFA